MQSHLSADPIHILLTGASRGIGAAIAERLGNDDRVRLVSTSSASGDLSNPSTAGLIWTDALTQLDGKIDILINNAGVFEANPIELSEVEWLENWHYTMDVNLTAAALLCREAVRHFEEYDGGRIINIASRAAYRGDSPEHWHYAASKAGMVAMTKTIARGYARDNILAFAVCPGFTMTGMADDYLESRGGDKLLADIPLGRVADPDEVAEIVAFCAFNAPPSMTGAVLDVNGASYVR